MPKRFDHVEVSDETKTAIKNMKEVAKILIKTYKEVMETSKDSALSAQVRSYRDHAEKSLEASIFYATKGACLATIKSKPKLSDKSRETQREAGGRVTTVRGGGNN